MKVVESQVQLKWQLELIETDQQALTEQVLSLFSNGQIIVKKQVDA